VYVVAYFILFFVISPRLQQLALGPAEFLMGSGVVVCLCGWTKRKKKKGEEEKKKRGDVCA
jgi:hypothetical protein